MDKVDRPEATGTKINCYREFELCYLRHQYLRKSRANPTEKEIKPFMKIIRYCSYHTYYTYAGLFRAIGMDLDDIVNIGRTHLVSFIGLYSLDVPIKHDKFIDDFIDKNGRGPSLEDILKKDKANFTLFLKQRMEDLVRVCRQKVKNIRGHLAEEFLVFYGANPPPENINLLTKQYKKLGYKKLDATKFKSLNRKLGDSQNGPIYRINDLYYVTITLDHRELTLHDLQGAGLNPYEQAHNMTPEEILIQNVTETEFIKNRKKWHSMPKNRRTKKIRDFILAKQNDPRYTEEVKTARKLIRDK